MEHRIKVAIRNPQAWPKIQSDVIRLLHEARLAKRDAENTIATLVAWTEFYGRERQLEYSDFRLYEIEDGETHWVAARCMQEALRHHYSQMGYKTLGEYANDIGYEIKELPPDRGMPVSDFDSGGPVVVKTHAEWCQVSEPETVSTTAY